MADTSVCLDLLAHYVEEQEQAALRSRQDGVAAGQVIAFGKVRTKMRELDLWRKD